jgi:cytochrome c oxidase assembly factor CtaG
VIIASVDPLAFTFEPLFVALAAAMVVLYVRAAMRYRPGAWRVASFAFGVFLITMSVNSPLETLAIHYWLLAHLVQNALLADLAPPLVMLGLNLAMWEALDRRMPLVIRFCSNLGFALLFWLGAWYFVHITPVYEFALRHPMWLNVEHLALMTAGFVFWAPVIRARWWDRSPAVLVPYLLAAFVAASFLGLGLTFIPHPFYPYYVDLPRLDGISATEDQNLGGIAMTAEQMAVFVSAITYVLILLADREQRIAEEHERLTLDATERPV